MSQSRPLVPGLARLSNAAVRAIPVMSGLGTYAHSPLGRAVRTGLTPGFVDIGEGLQLWVDPHEYIGAVIALCGDFDRRVSAVLTRVIHHGDIVFDIGAHCGTVAIRAAAHTGPYGVVHAFEPQADLVAMLHRSREVNKLEQLHIHEIALSDSDGEGSLTRSVSPDNLGNRSLIAADPDSDEVVRVASTETWLAEHGIDHVDVVKIDVEGHESKVLGGLLAGLKVPPRCIVLESHPRPGKFEDRAEMRILLDAGYEVFRIDRDPLRLLLARTDVGPPGPPRSIDFVAIPAGAPGREVRSALGIA